MNISRVVLIQAMQYMFDTAKTIKKMWDLAEKVKPQSPNLVLFPEIKNKLMCSGGSVIIAPGGKVIAGPVFDREEILYADIDLNEVVKGKYEFDASGHYNRPDVYCFRMNIPE